ncbi:MoaD/ThiS family protein [Cellulomonas sp. P24]|uniref:MoaD/ThiS family protein n=1 Tax=Cellulomonas sp. P24 TaxID=2885206 RepID=UPI00216B3BE3|nr:MoaD/ThiS family protein [Cellulomonas sp. P24]MCR6491814.1 MoaD/ThiS family protein [Cellulomonas sp. P24]
MVTIRYFAAAAEAAGTTAESVVASTAGELHAVMVERHGPALERVLARCAVLSDGARLDSDDDLLAPDALVDVLPPFAGG